MLNGVCGIIENLSGKGKKKAQLQNADVLFYWFRRPAFAAPFLFDGRTYNG